MEESYTLTVIEDQTVPLAATPGGGLPVEVTLFIIAVLCVMAGCAVFYLYRYLERCRQLRLRLYELNGSFYDTLPSYGDAPFTEVERRYDLRYLESEVDRVELERVSDSALLR